MIEEEKFERKVNKMLKNENFRDSDRSLKLNNGNSKNVLASTEYMPVSNISDQYLADNENQNLLGDNQLLIGDRDMQSVIESEHGRPATVAQSSEDLTSFNENENAYRQKSFTPSRRRNKKIG